MITGQNWRHIKLAGTYVLDTDGGILRRIIVNTAAAGAITVYDGIAASTGTEIAVLKASVVENSYTYELPYVTGLTIVAASTCPDFTVVFN
jgi:hypothetical protein